MPKTNLAIHPSATFCHQGKRIIVSHYTIVHVGFQRLSDFTFAVYVPFIKKQDFYKELSCDRKRQLGFGKIDYIVIDLQNFYSLKCRFDAEDNNICFSRDIPTFFSVPYFRKFLLEIFDIGITLEQIFAYNSSSAPLPESFIPCVHESLSPFCQKLFPSIKGKCHENS